MNTGSHRRILKFFDQVSLASAIFLALVVSRPNFVNLWTVGLFAGILVIAMFLWFLVAEAFDAYEREKIYCLKASITSTLRPIVILSLIALLPSLFIRGGVLDVLPGIVSAMFLIPLGRTLAFYTLVPGTPRRLLLIGDGQEAEALLESAQPEMKHTHHVLGYVDGRSGQEVSSTAKFPYMGSVEELSTVLATKPTDAVILADGYAGEVVQRGILAECIESGVEVLPLAELYAEVTGRVPIDYVSDTFQSQLPLERRVSRILFCYSKRLMDIALSSLGLICLAFATPFIALAIYLESPGPIFFKQKRVGKGGRVFEAYKFRSMIPNAESGKAIWAEQDDPRVTRVGKILRKTHVDEFPQFLNILKGEMSAVGPRPERPEFVANLEKEIPLYRARHAVKPGMAGWGLVKQGYAASWEDSRTKLEYDLYYIQHQSIRFDLVILAKTFLDTFTLRGR